MKNNKLITSESSPNKSKLILFLSLLLVPFGGAFAHDADPSSALTANYSIFGADGVQGLGAFGTATGGRVGTNLNLTVPNWQSGSAGYGANFGGSVWVRGNLSFGSHSANKRFVADESSWRFTAFKWLQTGES